LRTAGGVFFQLVDECKALMTKDRNSTDSDAGTVPSHFRCIICSITTTDEAGLWAHFDGQKHTKKLKLLNMQDPNGTAHTVPATTAGSSGAPAEKEIQHTDMPFRCEICGIFCTDTSGLEAHFAGQKHKKRVMKMQNVGEAESGGLDCETHNSNQQHAVSILNEYAQHTTQPISYTSGPIFGGSPTFVVFAEMRDRSGEVIHAKGFGSSKKEAKLNAAKQALRHLHNCKLEGGVFEGSSGEEK
jgi:hypothetical protein